MMDPAFAHRERREARTGVEQPSRPTPRRIPRQRVSRVRCGPARPVVLRYKRARRARYGAERLVYRPDCAALPARYGAPACASKTVLCFRRRQHRSIIPFGWPVPSGTKLAGALHRVQPVTTPKLPMTLRSVDIVRCRMKLHRSAAPYWPATLRHSKCPEIGSYAPNA